MANKRLCISKNLYLPLQLGDSLDMYGVLSWTFYTKLEDFIPLSSHSDAIWKSGTILIFYFLYVNCFLPSKIIHGFCVEHLMEAVFFVQSCWRSVNITVGPSRLLL